MRSSPSLSEVPSALPPLQIVPVFGLVDNMALSRPFKEDQWSRASSFYASHFRAIDGSEPLPLCACR